MDVDNETIVKRWSDMFASDVLQYTAASEATDEEVFADIYQSLAHSSMAQTMVQLEHSHANVVDDSGPFVPNDNGEEWERTCRASHASHVRETQRREFRHWIATVHEANMEQSGEGLDSLTGSSSITRSDSAFAMSSMASAARSESFTITLGAQMKAMHNLRLVSADVMNDLCKYSDDEPVALPQRLQTSMGLYSNNLSGMVLLTDDATLTGSTVASRPLVELCNRAADFHFAPFEQQVESIRNQHLKSALTWRRDYSHRHRMAFGSGGDTDDHGPDDVGHELKSGDAFVTRHSNLCDTHVVFHMVADTSVYDGNMNSRHPVIMGIRNILKAASMSSVTSVAMPLFLVPAMDERMTVAWCMRRAELVFKCVKGFMMEVASWGGAEIKTLHFVVPKEIDQDVFGKLALMLPTIFRISNPIRAA